MPRNLHIVPEGHLKYFTKPHNQKFFKLNKYTLSRPKEVYPAMVCYQKDYYQITNQEFLSRMNTVDEYFVESSFDYERNFIETTVQLFKSKTPSIPKSIIFKLIELILNFKIRNESYRRLIVYNRIQKLESHNIPIRRGQEKTGDEIALDEIHNYAIVKYKEKDSWLIGMIEDLLVNCSFEVLIPSAENDFVTTTDNPGYTITISNEISPTNFLEFKEVFFPICSSRLLKISRKQDDRFSLEKTINYREVSTDELFKINLKMLDTANQYVFCENKYYLNVLREYIKEFPRFGANTQPVSQ